MWTVLYRSHLKHNNLTHHEETSRFLPAEVKPFSALRLEVFVAADQRYYLKIFKNFTHSQATDYSLNRNYRYVDQHVLTHSVLNE